MHTDGIRNVAAINVLLLENSVSTAARSKNGYKLNQLSERRFLRRAPQPAPSPPPYSVGSPESARLPSPPPAPTALSTSVQVHTPLPAPVPVMPPSAEPIDLSVRRLSPVATPVLSYAPPTIPEQPPPRKPFKLFRPYLLEDEEEKRPALASLPVSNGVHVSAFMPVQSAAGCALAACPVPRWCTPAPSFSAPLR